MIQTQSSTQNFLVYKSRDGKIVIDSMGPSRQKMTNLPAKILRFGIYKAGRDYYLCDGTAMYLLEDGLKEMYDVTVLFDETFALTRFHLFARNTAADQATYKLAVIDPETMEVKQVMKVGREIIKFLVEMRSEVPRYSSAYREGTADA